MTVGGREDRDVLVLEAGAEDLKTEGDNYEVTTDPKDFAVVRDALNAANITITHAEVTRIPGTTVELNEDVARKVLKLMDVLDDHDDVQNVSANFDISDEIMEALKDEG